MHKMSLPRSARQPRPSPGRPPGSAGSAPGLCRVPRPAPRRSVPCPAPGPLSPLPEPVSHVSVGTRGIHQAQPGSAAPPGICQVTLALCVGRSSPCWLMGGTARQSSGAAATPLLALLSHLWQRGPFPLFASSPGAPCLAPSRRKGEVTAPLCAAPVPDLNCC